MEPAETVKLLLVDDRQEDLDALKMMLSEPTYTLVTARSGSEALKKILLDEFAVILLDVMLPGMDGFEIARLIQQRDRSRHTPILFLTAMGAEMNYIYRAYSAGAVDYLIKPIEPDVVRAKVTVFANLFRQDRRIRRQAEALHEAERREREREVAELRRSNEKRYRNLADAIPAIVWTARPDGMLMHTNRAWHLFTGLDKEQTRGWAWLAAVHPEDREAVESGWRAAIAEETVFTMECRLRGARAGDRAHILHAIPERDQDGTVVGWLGTMTDCEELRRAIHARDQFLATASHELRTPITTLSLVLTSLRKMASGAPSADLARRVLGKVEVATRQADRLERLVSALLDVTRIAGGRPLIDRESCDVAQLVKDVLDRMGDEAARAGSSLALTACEPAAGRLDPLRIDQVVTNIVSNAIRYGGGKPIEVAVRTSGDRVKISVRDNGCGMAPEDLGRLFGQFQRIDSRSHQTGLGLGLYISKHIVRAHGGEITVWSEVGQGSLFTIDLPLAPPDVEAESEPRRISDAR